MYDDRKPFEYNDDHIRIKDLARLAAEFSDSDKIDVTRPFKETYSQVKNSFQSEIVIAAYIRRYIDLFNKLVDEFNDHIKVFNNYAQDMDEKIGFLQDQVSDIDAELDNLTGRVDTHDTILEQLKQTTKDLANSIEEVRANDITSANYNKTTQTLELTKGNGEIITTTIPQFDDSALIGLIESLNKQINSIRDQIADLNNNINGSTTLEGNVNTVGGQLSAIGINIENLSYGGSMVYNKLSGGDR